ncbi:hypothetical protein C6Y14_25315, partial [Streptomyces dioscori]
MPPRLRLAPLLSNFLKLSLFLRDHDFSWLRFFLRDHNFSWRRLFLHGRRFSWRRLFPWRGLFPCRLGGLLPTAPFRGRVRRHRADPTPTLLQPPRPTTTLRRRIHRHRRNPTTLPRLLL